MEDAHRHVCPPEAAAAKGHTTAVTAPAKPASLAEPLPHDVARFEPQCGDILAGRYALIEKAGEGGGGIVFRAYDSELEIFVALKVLLPEVADALLPRFKREIKITREIDHPSVSRVFDIGKWGGLTFLTMRWIDGKPLSRRVAGEGPLKADDLQRLAAGLVAALAAAHRLGVVHRDVKPGNVMVAPSGDPVLVDFGIARLGPDMESDEGTSPLDPLAQARRGEPLTAQGVYLGTPSYMAPEQARGEPAQPATDLWALALTLAYAATGELDRPAQPGRLFAPLGRPFASLLARCLSDDPACRPRSAAAIQELLERGGRRRLALGIGAAGLCVVLATTGAAIVAARWAAPPVPPLVHVEPLDNPGGSAAFAWLERGVPELVALGLESSGQVHLAVDVESRRRAARITGRVLEGGPTVQVELALYSPAGELLERRRIEDAAGDALFRGVDSAIAGFLGSLGVPTVAGGRERAPPVSLTGNVAAFAHHARGSDLLRRYRYDDAVEELRKATELDPGFALAHLERYLASEASRQGSRAGVAAALELARAHRDRLPPSHRELLEVVLGQKEKPGSREVLDRLRTYLTTHPPDGAVYRMAVRVTGSGAAFRRAVMEEWAARLPEDPEAHNQLGYVLFLDFSDAARAEREFREYLRLAPDEANAHHSYGQFLMHQGRLEAAAREFERALELDSTFTGAAVDRVDAALRGDQLGEAAVRLGRVRSVVPVDSRDFERLVGLEASIPLIAGDVAASLARLESIARQPATGGRAYLPWAYEAVLWALAGKADPARRRAEKADRAHRRYHGSDAGGLRTLRPYVQGLSAYRTRSRAALAAAAAEVRAVLAVQPGPEAAGRSALLEGLLFALDGDPSRAAEHLRVPPASWSRPFGAPFLAALERARALVQAGRMSEAMTAYEEAMARRPAEAVTPEAAYLWRSCLGEAAAHAKRLGDAGRAAALDQRLAALPSAGAAAQGGGLHWVPRPRSSRPVLGVHPDRSGRPDPE